MIRRARRRSWRRWPWGPKHGIARRIAVYGTPGADSFAASLGACAELRSWAANRGVVLNDQPDDLVVLDRVLDEIRAAPATEARVATDIGMYLGTVIVSTIPGASWHAWPNGHPVVAVPHGKPIDVVAMADQCLRDRRLTLADIYADAASRR